MSATSKDKIALGAGVVLGLVVSAVVIISGGPSVSPSASGHPASLPAGAIWSKSLFGAPHWFHCEAGERELTCSAYSPGGVEVMKGQFVPADPKATLPAAPINDVIAANVAKIWVAKMPMLPHGTIEFPAERVSVDFVRGKRAGPPAKL